ncbi:unnamed protein product [Mytilus edulis]|uniref:Uncharacterized protein n=1 Tax=Mytilus edulis TaxID=6550 RepID=A0A8S3UG69_MYTED|nr:unnamed protein product [Mytilus edulis]
MSESSDENQQIDKVDMLSLLAPEKVNIRPVTKITHPECERVEIDDEIKTVASKSIITGNSPCNDSHYQKIVFNRRPEGDLVLGKIKKRDTIVICNTTKQKINHVNLDTNKSDYEDTMYYINRFRDVRKTDDEDISSYVFHVPKLERYAEVVEASCRTDKEKNTVLRWMLTRYILAHFSSEMRSRSGLATDAKIEHDENKPMAMTLDKKNVSDLIGYMHSNMTDEFNVAGRP